jgi:ribosomal protein S25
VLCLSYKFIIISVYRRDDPAQQRRLSRLPPFSRQGQVQQDHHEGILVTIKKKAQLVDLVTKQQWSIYKASKKLKLSNSTAKSILKNFEKYGTLLEKFTKNRILRLRESER